MSEIIKHGVLHDDAWQGVRLADGEGTAADDALAALPLPPAGSIVPLALWLARRDELLAAGPHAYGVWLAGDAALDALLADLPQLALIAIDFPKFADGRGYSLAALLRRRYQYTGELRAIGDVLRDQFFFMLRCGFDVLQPREGKYTTPQLEAALASLKDFSEPYQGAVDRPQPLFRRQPRSPLQKDAA